MLVSRKRRVKKNYRRIKIHSRRLKKKAFREIRRFMETTFG